MAVLCKGFQVGRRLGQLSVARQPARPKKALGEPFSLPSSDSLVVPARSISSAGASSTGSCCGRPVGSSEELLLLLLLSEELFSWLYKSSVWRFFPRACGMHQIKNSGYTYGYLSCLRNFVTKQAADQLKNSRFMNPKPFSFQRCVRRKSFFFPALVLASTKLGAAPAAEACFHHCGLTIF